MVNQMQYTVCLCVVINILQVTTSPWASPSQEILDELNDVEIYKAIVQSMDEWQRKKTAKKKNHERIKRQDSNVCYPDLGCFEASGPFGYLDMLPSTPEEIDTKFLLYPGHSKRRSGNPPGEVPFRNLTDAFTWAKQGFNNTLPTKVMIHGFGSDCSHIWIYEMRSALMAVEEVNVICVDWGNGATLPNYVKATANTRLVGKQLSMLIKGLVDHTGLSLRNMHLIGFSLGAHVAGFAGAELGNLSRITGLDPAGPLFESQDPRARLDQTDADFVDVIHSNGENLILGGLGSWQPMGHVDFYPNGGRMQKGCSNIFVGAVSDIIWSSAVEGRSLCNHRRAYKFFTDSVSPRCHFPAFPCNSYDDFLSGECFPCTEERKCGNMGYYADRSKGKGQLYLITRDEEPFCAHQYHIKIESTPGEAAVVSYGKIQVTLIGDSLLNETFSLTKKEDEEMKLGSSVSRIIVPHPILLEPSKIQIVYNAYSGWLTSGLLQWRIDKITLSDSFGKSSSVCKKNLVLQSGVPVTLPLYPGECNLPTGVNNIRKEADDRFDKQKQNYTIESGKSKFVPTTVVKIGNEYIKPSKEDSKDELSLKDAIDIFNLPWHHDKGNGLDIEAESSRAFNTRVVKMTKDDRNKTEHASDNRSNETRDGEIVEPILKTHSSKNGRSHNPAKHEITEPILGPTTSKITGTPKVIIHSDIISKLKQNEKEIIYNFYDIEKESDWIPAVNPSVRNLNDQWKKEDEMNLNKKKDDEDAFNVIVRTVQFLPQRLARMFEEAEKYARETILPLVSTYTPKFISDFITPREQNKYLPLSFEIATDSVMKSTTEDSEGDRKEIDVNKQVREAGKSFNDLDLEEPNFDSTSTEEINTLEPMTNIQKIKGRRKDRRVTSNPVVNKSPSVENTKLRVSTNISIVQNNTEATVSKETTTESTSVTRKHSKAIYIDLPIFEESTPDIKYIPLHGEDAVKEKSVT